MCSSDLTKRAPWSGINCVLISPGLINDYPSQRSRRVFVHDGVCVRPWVYVILVCVEPLRVRMAFTCLRVCDGTALRAYCLIER